MSEKFSKAPEHKKSYNEFNKLIKPGDVVTVYRRYLERGKGGMWWTIVEEKGIVAGKNSNCVFLHGRTLLSMAQQVQGSLSKSTGVRKNELIGIPFHCIVDWEINQSAAKSTEE